MAILHPPASRILTCALIGSICGSQAILRGDCIGIRRENANQLFIVIVNVPEQVN